MDFPTNVPSGLLIWVENPKYKYFCYLLIVLGSPEYPNVHIFDWLKQRSAPNSWANQGQKWIPRTR